VIESSPNSADAINEDKESRMLLSIKPPPFLLRSEPFLEWIPPHDVFQHWRASLRLL
jgi:hypothetical protein